VDVPKGESTPVSQQQWQLWANENLPKTPTLELGVELPSMMASSILVIDALSPNASRWEVYVGEDLVSSPAGVRLAVNLSLTDGVHSIRVVAIAENWPTEESMLDFGPAVSSAEFTKVVTVDTIPPVFHNLETYPSADGHTVLVKGSVLDNVTGADWVGVAGYSESVTPDENGQFELSIPLEAVGAQTTLSVVGLDKLNNETVASVLVIFPPDRWERISENGALIEIRTIPDFNPFDLKEVGYLEILNGWDGDYWVKYQNHTKVFGPEREPNLWRNIRIGLILLVILVAAVVIRKVYRNATRLSRIVTTGMEIGFQEMQNNLIDETTIGSNDFRNNLLAEELGEWFKLFPAAGKAFLKFIMGRGFDTKLKEHARKNQAARLNRKEGE
jgi:hypothetical protein